MYASQSIPPGWVVCVDGLLLHKKLGSEGGPFCSIIDRDTLKVVNWVGEAQSIDALSLCIETRQEPEEAVRMQFLLPSFPAMCSQ